MIHVVWSAHGNSISALTSKTSSKVNLLNDDTMSLCDHNCVILQTNRARYTLNMKILDLINKESVSEAFTVVELVYKFNEKSTTSV